jgi:hypothetical protein
MFLLNNFINHDQALNKLIWWKYAYNSGRHIISPTCVSFHGLS